MTDFWQCSSRMNPTFSQSFNNATSRQEARDYSTWCNNMVRLIKRFIDSLSDAVDAWDEFHKGEISYFRDDDPTATSSPLNSSIRAVVKAFHDLKRILRKLRELEKELCKKSPQGVSRFPSIEVIANEIAACPLGFRKSRRCSSSAEQCHPYGSYHFYHPCECAPGLVCLENRTDDLSFRAGRFSSHFS
jgi:hypothetical protein